MMSKDTKIIVLALIVLLFGVFVFYSFFRPKSPPAAPPINTGLTEAEKENAARIMNQQLINVPPLTAKQKEDIAKKMMQSLPK